MIVEAQSWDRDGRQRFSFRIADLVGGFVVYGHNPEEFASYLQRNHITL
jgi:hypothetical protein